MKIIMNKKTKEMDDNLEGQFYLYQCEYCHDFFPKSECKTIIISTLKDDFEVGCNECYNNLYKDKK